MKKHFKTGQIKWIIAISLLVSLITHIPDVIQGFKDAHNMVPTIKIIK